LEINAIIIYNFRIHSKPPATTPLEWGGASEIAPSETALMDKQVRRGGFLPFVPRFLSKTNPSPDDGEGFITDSREGGEPVYSLGMMIHKSK
jgi:hypothetical protein